MFENNMSPADFSALMGNGANGMGGSIWVWLLIILFFIGGFGGNGWGNNDYMGSALNTFATASSQNEILLGQKFDALSRQVNQVGDGLCSSTYALNNSITNEGRNIQMQIAECCCGNKEATAQVRYDMANFAAQINSNIDNKFAALEKAQLEQTIAAQQSQINQLSMAQQMAGVVKYPMASTYAMMNNPFCGCNTCCAN